MEQYKISEVEMRFLGIIWHMEPVTFEKLGEAVREEFGWKKAETEKMLKKLCGKGIAVFEEGLIRTKVSQTDFQEGRAEECEENRAGNALKCERNRLLSRFFKSFWAPIAFEEGDVKGRIKNIVRYRKTAVILSVCAIAVCILAGGLFFTKIGEAEETGQGHKIAEAGKAVSESAAGKAEKSGKVENKAENKIKGDGGMSQYFAWIKKIQDGMLDNFQTVSTEEMGISDIFKDSDKGNDKPGYAFVDLDSDGMYELLLGKSIQEYSGQAIIYGIYGLQDGQVVPAAVCEGEMDQIYLCKNGMLKREMWQYNEAGTMDKRQYLYYKYQNLHLQLVETLAYDGSKITSEEWAYCEAADGELQEETAVREAEAYKILNKYASEVVLLQTLIDKEKLQKAREAEIQRAAYPNPEKLAFADLSGFLFQREETEFENTELIIKQNGVFEGHYGDISPKEGYHYNYVAQDCYFRGQFTNLRKTGDYAYAMTCTGFQIEGTLGEEHMEGETLVINSEPGYFFQKEDEFCLYLPGMREEALPDGHEDWGMTGLEYGVLTSYVLVNRKIGKAYMVDTEKAPVYEIKRSKYYEKYTYEMDRRVPKADFSEEEFADLRKKEGFQDKEALSFSELKDMKFSNYRIGEDTYLEVEEDGSFYVRKKEKQRVFEYDEEYPNGTIYETVLKGRFSDLKKAGPYKYTLKCNSLKKEPAGKERIEDGRRYITVEEEILGFEKFREFELYLPGYRIIELPEGYFRWSDSYLKYDGIRTRYSLYNVKTETMWEQ